MRTDATKHAVKKDLMKYLGRIDAEHRVEKTFQIKVGRDEM